MYQEIFEKLRALQDILSRKYEIENEIKEIPRSLSAKTELLKRLKKSFIEKNSDYEEVKKEVLEIKRILGEAELQREKYEKQMDYIKTQRDYEVLDKAIRDSVEKEQKLRNDLQIKQKHLDELAEEVKKEEEMINIQNEEISSEEEKINEKIGIKKESLAELEQEEQKIIPGMDDEILYKFERIIRNKAGLGIVSVVENVCNGCHMILPQQFVNKIRGGEEIMFCPYCSRILCFEDREDRTDFAFSDIDAGSLADLVDKE